MNENPSAESTPLDPQSKEKPSKQRISVVKLAFLILGGVIVLFVAILLLLYLLLPEEEQKPEKEIHFYPVVEQNIFDNPQYLAKDRGVYYCDDPTGYGLTTVITDEDRMTFDVKVRFVEIYLNCLISGDHEMLKTLCTEELLKESPIPNFTQQMLYDMHVYYQDEEAGEGGEKKFMYRLEYKIFQNNGTYRRDVGSDGAKAEYLVLTVNADESEIKIDEIRRS